ncbi:hypothetical protein BGZ97_009082, partial [Linnemannia gamsii]
ESSTSIVIYGITCFEGRRSPLWPHRDRWRVQHDGRDLDLWILHGPLCGRRRVRDHASAQDAT